MPTPPNRSSRRSFLGGSGALLMGGALVAGCASRAAAGGGSAAAAEAGAAAADEQRRPRLVVSTWKFGRHANKVAWERLTAGVDHPIDAAEAGVRVTEADVKVPTVGLGGRPNAHGDVELDASIMRGDTLDCGSVAGLQHILHPISVARRVMEQTPHVMLVGAGAHQFAVDQGFPEQDLLTPNARKAWEAWKVDQAAGRETEPFPDDHDTIGLIALDRQRFGVALTTSGWSFKLPGRVGDSPVIGAGGYCDDEAGAAVATGNGEEVIRTCGSFAIVDAMRRGSHPLDGCREVLERIRRGMDRAGRTGFVGLIAVDRKGRVGAMGLTSFKYSLTDGEGTRVLDSESLS